MYMVHLTSDMKILLVLCISARVGTFITCTLTWFDPHRYAELDA